ncbi:FAD-dependent oxidoreductase (plasmid) [Roseomonas mucosa]|nr:FAD-dependent oxidoreductase [Roseomonas mucosa]
MRTTVAIIGGGVAGLCAARLLRAARVEFQLLEARDRLGGRILSVDASGRSTDDGFDLGPSWFWPDMQPALGALVEELGLAAFAQNSDGDVLLERTRNARPQRHRGMRQEPQSMRLVGGTGALVRALAKDLPPQALQLGVRVTRMALGEAGVTLRFVRSDGQEEILEAAQVIAATPPRLLQVALVFAPSLPSAVARRWRDAATWMAPHAKFLALYDRPFWREAGLSGTAQSMVGPLVEIHDASTSSGAAALFGFCGVEADRRATMGEAALAGACLEQLARLFGPEAARPSGTLFKDWAADAWTATADDRNPTGHPLPGAAAWVTGPWQERLSLGGSETSTTAPGYLAGAVDAAERAVSEVTARLMAPADQG